ncbi:MAG: phosphoribosylanthranilate isomerase [Pseudomonadota bacterium]
MPIDVKICGVTRPEDVAAAAGAGAAFLGFVFFDRSPRALSFEAAKTLTEAVPQGVRKVALTVDGTDDFFQDLLATVPLDMLQLHGSESLDRVAEIRARFGCDVMKALAIGGPEDVAKIAAYEAVADWILADAKPPKGADRPGGNAVSFDWALLRGRDWAKPWMLAGGLTPENAAEAAEASGASILDVSSGVESAPGVKDPAKIAAFLKAVRP